MGFLLLGMIEFGLFLFLFVGVFGWDLLFLFDFLFFLLELDLVFFDVLVEVVWLCFDDLFWEDIFRVVRLGVLLDLFGGGICLLFIVLLFIVFGNGWMLLFELLLLGVGVLFWGEMVLGENLLVVWLGMVLRIWEGLMWVNGFVDEFVLR